MPINTPIVYEMRDHVNPFPPRSRLYPLEPIGLGTPYVESLTSYINRLAKAHCVLPSKLITQEVLPHLEVPNTAPEENQNITTVNGMSSLAKEWIRVLEQLTMREDLQFLSMVCWTNIADQRGVVRRTRAWCPVCYKEWLQTGQVIYEPLLWSLKVVTRCFIHHQCLIDRCPRQDCKRAIPLLTNSLQTASCPICGYSLAERSTEGSLEKTPEDNINEEIQRWVVNAVGVLLSATPKLPFIPLRDRVASGITAYLSHTISGSDISLARKLGISKALLMTWQKGMHLPRFNTLLMMCFHMNVSPLKFLTGNVESLFFTQPTMQIDNILKASQNNGPINSEELRTSLTEFLREGANPVLSLRAVAKKLGYPVTTLTHYFPEQCQTIAERYQQRKKVDYSQSLEAFLLSNEKLTLNEIARRLGCPVTTLTYRYPELCRAITAQTQKVVDKGAIHEVLQKALQCEEPSFPTVTAISRHFGCSTSILYHHFPDLCYKLTKKHKDVEHRVITSETTVGTSSNDNVEISINKSKPLRKVSGVKNFDKVRKELENLLEADSDCPMTMTELSERFGCARHTLRAHFPDLCDRLMKKQEKEEYVNKLRKVLEEVLSDDVTSTPSVNQLARQLGCSSAILRQNFPDLCKLISQLYMGLPDVEMQRNALEAAIRSGEAANLSINELARRLGCSNSTLYNRFPDLCQHLVKRRWQANDIDGMRKKLESVLANNDEPPPTLKYLSEYFGCSLKNLEYYFPEMCRAIVERRRRLLGPGRFKEQLEEMLVGDEPISISEAARRLGCTNSSLRNCFPDLCTSLSARYLAYRKYKSLEAEEKTCHEIREIVLDFHARGEYPAQNKVQALVSKPGYFWRSKVKETWLEAVRELGLLD